MQYQQSKISSTPEFKNSGDIAKQTINFDEIVFYVCKVKDQKNIIDWAERDKTLRELCDKYRRNDGHYDCLVPGSGVE